MSADLLNLFGIQLHLGDCLATLRTMPDACVDSIVTDPPYGLSFMGKRWDYDVPSAEVWSECLRVLKPGGHLLAFAGTRTQHRMAVRIEDAGFEIRDMIAWVYGSGFPKSLDVSKALDKAAGVEREVVGLGVQRAIGGKDGNSANHGNGGIQYNPVTITAPATDAARQWQGWGTALKPALEPITVARKSLAGTVAENVLAHGTGALNIDGCRVPTDDDLNGGAYAKNPTERNAMWGEDAGKSWVRGGAGEFVPPTGRWPANLVHDGSDEVLAAFPQAPGQMADVSRTAPSPKTSNVYGRMNREGEPSANSDNEGAVGFKMKPGARRLDTGSAARFFYCAKASKRDRDEGLDDLPEIEAADFDQRPSGDFAARMNRVRPPVMKRNTHPTVKPTDLMRYLCRLVTPPGGVVLDPFMGSGSTGKAAVLEGFQFIGCELSDDYLAVAQARILAAIPM